MTTIYIERFAEEPTQTLGELRVVVNGAVVFRCKTLELPWKDNQKNISRIKEGTYKAQKHISPKFGKCIWLNDSSLLPRTEILIHKGNFYIDTKGCILVGRAFTDIDNDGYRDVTSSKATIDALLDSIPEEEFTVVIKNKVNPNTERTSYRAKPWNSFLSTFKSFLTTWKYRLLSGKSLAMSLA